MVRARRPRASGAEAMPAAATVTWRCPPARDLGGGVGAIADDPAGAAPRPGDHRGPVVCHAAGRGRRDRGVKDTQPQSHPPAQPRHPRRVRRGSLRLSCGAGDAIPWWVGDVTAQGPASGAGTVSLGAAPTNSRPANVLDLRWVELRARVERHLRSLPRMTRTRRVGSPPGRRQGHSLMTPTRKRITTTMTITPMIPTPPPLFISISRSVMPGPLSRRVGSGSRS